MKRTVVGLWVAACALGLVLTPSAHAAPAVATATALNTNSRGTVVLLVASSAIARKFVVDQANTETRKAIMQAETAQREALKQTRRADLNAKQRALAEAKLAETTTALEAALDSFKRQNIEFSAAIAVYRQGIEDLVSNPNPDVQAAMARYADGESGALDEIQAVVRLVRKAEAAALQQKHAGEQRAVARLYGDARLKGERSPGQVISAWEEAAELDPKDFETQLVLGKLYGMTERWDAAKIAANTAWSVAKPGEQQLDSKGLQIELAATQDDSSTYDREIAAYLQLANSLSTPENKNNIELTASAVHLFYDIYWYGMADAARPSLISDMIELSSMIAKDGDQNNPNLGFAYTATLNFAGRVAMSLDQYDKAAKIYGSVVDMARALSKDYPQDVALMGNTIQSLQDLAFAQYEAGDLKAAKAAMAEAIAEADKMVAAYPESPLALRHRAKMLSDDSAMLTAQGQLIEADQRARFALAQLYEAYKKDPDDNEIKDFMVQVKTARANLDVAMGDTESARANFGEGVSMARAAATGRDASFRSQQVLAKALISVGSAALEDGYPQSAARDLGEALEIAQRLSTREGVHAQSIYLLYDASIALSEVAIRNEGGIDAVRRGLGAAEGGMRETIKATTSLKPVRLLRHLLHQRCHAEREVGDLSAAEVACVASLAVKNPDYNGAEFLPERDELARMETLQLLGDVKLDQGDTYAALAIYAKVAAYRRAAYDKRPYDLDGQIALVEVMAKTGRAQALQGDTRQAITTSLQALLQGIELRRDALMAVKFERLVHGIQDSVGYMIASQGDLDGIKTMCGQSGGFLTKLVTAHPTHRGDKRALASSCSKVVTVKSGKVDWRTASAQLKSLAENKDLAPDSRWLIPFTAKFANATVAP